ncbi:MULTISPECIES: chromate efflux transporter [Bacteroidota]|uniref:Chromate transporter n=4 Tax=Bacteroidota TaxID=976 RepID=A0A1W1YKI8_9FLAO|nr:MULTISPECIES: chromate efflux transporter [Bacteroidota]MBU7569638.1 chromate efflux transporter [Flavobacterium sp.]MBX2926107.1 chromate efflux transporter [Chitinophagaceae bacterium]MDV3873958.1 chromate transporter [Elizabethkingia anophelis]PZO34828.1 MAG: chromate transporter [Flavobacteriaceae bacterium]SJN52533.1 Chromate transport protein ChrA [Sphingobacterium faecium PCAi_F2.5]
MERDIQIKEIAKLFLKLGFIGFGGPAAHIAMMQQEVVVKKKWMSEQHFLDLLGATNLIPGPNSTEMAIHIGYDKGSWKGLIVAGLCFILPAVFITGIFAWLYQQYGQLPEVQPFIYGIKPAIIAIIIGAVFPLAKKSVKSTFLAVVGILVLVLSLFGISEIYLMFGAGLLAMGLYSIQSKRNTLQSFIPLAFLQIAQSPLLSETNTKLFWIFLKIGAILYGSGYVLFAFLDTELVATGLLTRQQLMDAIAVGQFTPGPVFSSVTFIGYQINGLSGAVISTIAIFLPSFILVALLNPLMKKMRQSKGLSIFLDAVNVASVAIIVAICLTMGKETITDWRTILIAMISAIVVFKFKKINSAFVVIGGALLGYLFNLI